MVWAARPVPELEEVKAAANRRDKGAIRDPDRVGMVRAFLEPSAEAKRETETDKVKRRTNIKGLGEVLVFPLELEHR